MCYFQYFRLINATVVVSVKRFKLVLLGCVETFQEVLRRFMFILRAGELSSVEDRTVRGRIDLFTPMRTNSSHYEIFRKEAFSDVDFSRTLLKRPTNCLLYTSDAADE